jgi:hypothetical protein
MNSQPHVGYSHGVGSPEDEGVETNGDEEGAELGALGGGVGAAVQCQVPNDEDEGNAGNRVPAPLLGSVLFTKSSEQTSQDHDQVGDHSHDDVSTRHASQKTKVEEQEGSGDGPVDVTSPEDLTVDLGEGVGNVVVLLTDLDLVDGDTMAGGHSEVRDGRGDGDDCGDGVVETLGLV